MRYLLSSPPARETALRLLADMPGFLAARFLGLPPDAAVRPGPGGSFSPVEQCWHLADLERRGFAVRIRRLLAEENPELPDFDGARAAEEGNYRSRSVAEGIAAFRACREENIAALRAVPEKAWLRGGTQEGVGPVTLCDIPAMMAEHDAGHRGEIEAADEGALPPDAHSSSRRGSTS